MSRRKSKESDPINVDLLHGMLRGDLPTGLEHLSDKELFLATEAAPENGSHDTPEHALSLLREMCSRPAFVAIVKAAARSLPSDEPR